MMKDRVNRDFGSSTGQGLTPTVVIVWTDPSVCCVHVGPGCCAVHLARS